MDRAEAFKTLRLDESADGQMVQTAYWMLVRQAQDKGTRDIKARWEIEKYNEAYAVLSPDARKFAPSPQKQQAAAEGTEFLDRAVDWLSEEALRTRARWPGRNLEIGIIAAATLLLMVVALADGAPFLLVMVCVLAVFGAIWAPWRRNAVERADGDENRSSVPHQATEAHGE